MSSLRKYLSQPYSVLWRTALVRLPRIVPISTLRYTSPEGPHPFVFNLPSRKPHEYTIPLYIFVPDAVLNRSPDDATPVPVLVDFHGGGFYLGSCLEQAPFCARLARETDCVVISVDYRMGPFHRFPAAIEDGEDVLRALLEHDANGYSELRSVIASRIEKARREGQKRLEQEKEKQAERLCNGQIEEVAVPDPAAEADASPLADVRFDFDKTRIALSGFSSGGNLALNLALHLEPPELEQPWPAVFSKDHQAPIPVLLFYPSLDLRQLPSERTKPENMPVGSSFWGQVSDLLAPTYVARHESAHPRASPGLASIDAIHPAAKIFLVLAELDSLSEQSKTWVQKIQEHAKTDDVVVEEVRGVKHGWTQMPDSWLSQEERMLKHVCFQKARAFVEWAWTGSDKGEGCPTSGVSQHPSSTSTPLADGVETKIELGTASLEER
nr:putative thermophilic carboxylesterase est2 [Thecaphora frezii]